MKSNLSFFIISLLFLTSCSKETNDPIVQQADDGPEEVLEMASVARNFLFELIDIMQNNSVNRNTIDWQIFKISVFESAAEAQTIPETYDGVRTALQLLGDNHSSFRGANNVFIYEGELNCNYDDLNVPAIPSNIGYVVVSSYSGSSNDVNGIAFAQDIQDKIADQDTADLDGWIVDLRNNGGGNMWPMLAGIGPILGEGTAGYFIDPDNNQSSWGYSNGASIINGFPLTTVSNFYQLITQNPKVALLHNQAVASSGEAIVVAFKNRENTKSFGTSTCGLSTGNQGFNLSDGSFLNLTTTTFADRDQNLYGGTIAPDENSTNQDVITAAVAYINQ